MSPTITEQREAGAAVIVRKQASVYFGKQRVCEQLWEVTD